MSSRQEVYECTRCHKKSLEKMHYCKLNCTGLDYYGLDESFNYHVELCDDCYAKLWKFIFQKGKLPCTE